MTDRPDRPIGQAGLTAARLTVGVGLAILVLTGAAAVAGAPGTWVGGAILVGTATVIGGLIVVRRSERRRADRRQAAEASVRRLLEGLGRSTSPDAVATTMVDALRGASGADHVVIARLHPGERDIEAILVTASEHTPLATLRLPATLLAAPGGGSTADGIGPLVERLRADFGLRNAIARPLLGAGGPVGALVLSRRTEEPWAGPDVDVLQTAASELSIALERASAQQAAQVEARIDALTGLPNRRHFDELAALLARGRRAGDGLGVLMLDIDHFKRVNDAFGHAVGDAVLRAVADAIVSSIRAADTPARHGGEEFAVLLRRATPEQACDVALRIRAAVAAIATGPLGVEDGRPVSVSVGVAVGATTGETVAELVRRADDALYAAKRRGRDRVVVDEPAA